MKEWKELFHFMESVLVRNSVNEVISQDQDLLKEYNELKIDNQSAAPNKGISSKLKERCFTAIQSFIPSKAIFNSRQISIVKLIKYDSVAKILMGVQARYSSIEIYKDIYYRSKKIKEVDFLFNSSRELFMHYSLHDKNSKKAESYYIDCISSLDKIRYEVKSQWYYAEINSHVGYKKVISKEVINKAKYYFEELTMIDDSHKTLKFYTFYYSLCLFVYEPESEFQKLETTLKDGVRKFDQDYEKHVFQRIYVRIKLITCLIKLNKLEEAILYCKQVFDLSRVSSVNWVRSVELNILCLIRMKNIVKAESKSKELLKSKIFHSISRHHKMRLQLMDHYLTIYKMLVGRSKSDIKRIKLAKFLNSIPEFNADKKAMNIPIIILQILYFIIRKDDENLERRFDAVNKYLSRYLKTDTYYRSHCFIKMLLQVHRRNFHPVAIERHTKKYVEQLQMVSLQESKEPVEIELVKYEDLWEAVLKFCGKKGPDLLPTPM